MKVEEKLLQKWAVLIAACKAYYVDSEPTGISDSDYDNLERKAIKEDSFSVRDYVFDTYLKGIKTKNKYINKIKKEKVDGLMIDALKNSEIELKKSLYCSLKYDGSSIAIYLDSSTGIPKRIVTVGNLNIDDYGVDQTWKLLHFLPKKFPKGISAIQAEAVIDLGRLTDIDPNKARQKANGLINSKYSDQEVDNLLTLRAFRYFIDLDTREGVSLSNLNYLDVLNSFEIVKSRLDGHVMFAPAQVWNISEIVKTNITESDRTITRDGEFLNDGWVVYDANGTCVKALKFSGAGHNTEIIKTRVNSIRWNSQTFKGKDSWSSNVIIDPVIIKGCKVTKPSGGSVNKLIKNVVSPGAEVSIILANSTIPMVGEVFSPGNGDYQWPTCSCGYKLGEVDIFGSLLKCGNLICTERRDRMDKYVRSLKNVHKELNLNKLLIIDRFKWEQTDIDIDRLLYFIEVGSAGEYYDYLRGYLRTALQIKTLDLVWRLSYSVLKNIFEQCCSEKH